MQPQPNFARVVESSNISGERWLVVSPHDDDACLGAGLWIQAALQAGVRVYLLIVTDGRMGYCTLEQKHTIIEIRKRETEESCKILGIAADHLLRLEYPDGGLFNCQGRRQATPADAPHLVIAGCFGLQNALTYHLRKVRPQRVVVPTPTDLHPDHQITYNELMISLFHAQGEIWPELGPPTEFVPQVYEMAIYCDFRDRPNLELIADAPAFDRKLASIAAFASQKQIGALVDQVHAAGPYEYLRQVEFQFYSPTRYRTG